MQSGVAAYLAKLKGLRSDDPAQISQLAGLLARRDDVGRSEAAPELRENLDSLFTMIDAVDAAPTSAQMKYFRQLQSRYQELISQVDKLTRNTGR